MTCRDLRSTLFFVVFFVCGSFAVSADTREEPLTEVADLRYGVALYHYYQNQHFQALSDLLVAEERGGIQGHGDNPEIMLGGFYLAYGLDRTASDIFERLLDNNRPQKTRDAAWLYLAKIRYLRNDWQAVQEALGRISEKPSPKILDHMKVLSANVAIKQDRTEDAKELVDDFDPNNEWAPYLYFNMASLLAREGNHTLAVHYYARIARMKQRTEAHLSLYDKAMTAAGFAHLFDEDPVQAIAYFKQVRLDSPMSGRALLGYGWAQTESGRYREALSPWQALAKRSLIDDNTQEAMVAIPYAYEKLGLASAALNMYREAEAGFESELVTVDSFINSMNGKAMLDALKIDPSENVNWLNYARENQLSPQLSYLTTLFAKDSFQGVTQELRDLLVLQNKLTDWRSRMDFYYAMLDERDANRKREMDLIAKQEAFQLLDDMNQKRKEILAELNQLEADDNFLSMLRGKDRERLKRIVRAENNIKALEAAGRDVTEERRKVIKLRGLLLWDAGELFAERMWRARKTLEELEDHLKKTLDTQLHVQSIVDEGFDLEPYRVRIQASNQRIDAQLADIDQAINAAQEMLRSEVTNVLQEQRGRISYYLAQSRLGIARLLDDANEEAF